MQIAKNQKQLAVRVHSQPNRAIDNVFRYISHPEWLSVAADGVLSNSGANSPGIDGMTGKEFKVVEEVKLLSAQLKDGTYKPQPVRRTTLPKANGKMRPLGIPTIRDRVVQESLRMALEPIMEGKFLNCSTGFRPSRRAMDAIHLYTYSASNRVKMFWVVEGEIQGCFDNIPHRKLMGVLKQHVACKKTLSLVWKMLKVGVENEGVIEYRNSGVLQAGICSPLFTNIYLHELDGYWWEKYGKLTEGQKSYRRTKGLGNVKLIRYADDFLITTNGTKEFAQELKAEFGGFLSDRLGLELSEEKTLVTHVDDGFDFLGFRLQRVFSKQSNKKIVLVTPSPESVTRFKRKVRELTDRSATGHDVVNKFRAINQLITGWTNYYKFVNSSDVFSELQRYVHMRIYHWLRYKHSNVSAKGSVGKYVIMKYLGRHPRTGHNCWHVYGMWLKSLTDTRMKRYRINWPENGNPYLEPENYSRLTYVESVPIKANAWTGESQQRSWAVARQERLMMVGNRCEECGSTKALDAHHVISRSDGGSNSVGNLTIRCEACHKKVHVS